jgi:hypothetical protein
MNADEAETLPQPIHRSGIEDETRRRASGCAEDARHLLSPPPLPATLPLRAPKKQVLTKPSQTPHRLIKVKAILLRAPYWETSSSNFLNAQS